MRTLYHFPMSPFSRRARLCLLRKQLPFDALDAKADPNLLAEARKLGPVRTMPLLVEEDGRALADSTAISLYLDAAYPEAPSLWGVHDPLLAYEISSLVDVALNTLVDVGTRYFSLNSAGSWPEVRDEMVGRAQAALNGLGDRVQNINRKTIDASGWSAADIWLFTATIWLEGFPARAKTAPHIAQIASLGANLPPALSTWADAHRERADVLALG